MANVIRLKRASGSDPAASDLVSGEPAVRTDTGELFFKKDDGSIAKVAGAGGGPDFKYLALRNAANNGAASFPNADFTLVTSGTTTAITPTAANTLLVSVNGVIQKPNTGTSTPSQGFALSGSTIKFGANISSAPDFILYQESGGIGEPSDDTVSEVKLKVSNSPVNGYFLSAQSGNNGGLTWAAPVATSCTGNSATATALATARTINGTSFDGTANITVTAAAGTLTGNTLNSSVITSSLTSLGDLASLTVTGDLVVDTSTLKVDSSNNRVGIGTASPRSDSLLTVNGRTTNLVATNSSYQTGLNVTNNVNADFFVSVKNNSTSIGPSTSTPLCFHTGNTSNERMRIDSSGNVGIGTSSPSSLLHIADATEPAIRLQDTNAVNSDFKIYSPNGDNSLRIYHENTSSDLFHIASGGNVAIGHTSPTALLHIHGLFKTNSFHLTNGGSGRFISQGFIIGDAFTAGKSSADDRDTIFWNERALSTVFATNNTERMRITSAGNVEIDSFNSPSTRTLSLRTGYAANANGGTGIAAKDHSGSAADGLGLYGTDGVSIHTANAGTVFERMRIDTSGQVGIGTSSPATQLEVKDSTDSRITITAGNAISQAGINFADNSGVDGIITFDHNTRKLHLGAGTSSFTDGDLTIDSSGNVLINQPSEAAGKLGIKGTNSNGSTCYAVTNSGKALQGIDITCTTVGDGNFGGAISFGCGGNGRSAIAAIQDGNDDDRNGLSFFTHESNVGAQNSLERVRFLPDGDCFLGSASVAATHGSSNSSRGLVYDSDGGVGNHPFISMQHGSRSSGNPAHIKFQTAGNEEGSIRQSNLGFEISYNNTSDYRLKENVVDISDGITRLKTLKPRRYNWIADETNTTTDGFLAHEVMTAVPQAVTGTKDEVDENNKPVYQQIDQSKIVPLLVAALQEAISRIEALEAK